MHHQSLAAIIANDLNSLAHRIEALPAHPNYTAALNAVQEAEAAVKSAAVDLHQSEMRERFARADA
ncbi:hypothetical protein [Brevundimonas viscosa]|uniref:Uncharacterized protein n=1 Tax=Brevundimonas viscosa TaxID=871741 RepID=A0A1I6PQ23_9CAUL|nr:hypothetical protein [Brevundimonas viscosa]SFS42286.1 hypothetical protein SAMN05192570_1170 [Brevundimonas viscosa]